jgi:uncharacterized protein
MSMNDSIEVELKTPTGTLYGTLLMPVSVTPITIVIFHAGQGPSDRNGNFDGSPQKHDSLKLLAESLAAQGIATLRFDKRGVGKSEPALAHMEDLRFENNVEDMVSWLEYARKDSRFDKIVTVGHSEGSLIAMIASHKFGADAYVSIAGAGRPAWQIALEQHKKFYKLQLTPQEFAETERIVSEWREGRVVPNPALPLEFRNGIFNLSGQPYLISWYRYDPAKEIAKLKMPILVIHAMDDLQVTKKDSEILAKANPKAKLKLIKNMNHVLKEVLSREEKRAIHSNPNLPLNEELVYEVVKFLKRI